MMLILSNHILTVIKRLNLITEAKSNDCGYIRLAGSHRTRRQNFNNFNIILGLFPNPVCVKSGYQETVIKTDWFIADNVVDSLSNNKDFTTSFSMKLFYQIFI